MDRFRRMEIFVAVVEANQLTRAAKFLNLSKSAVSHALSDLEKYLGQTLLERHKGSWQLTDAGSVYYARCKKILADVKDTEEKIRGDDISLSGFIRLSAPDTFGSYTLVPVVSKFMEMHPNISIELNLTDRFVDLHEERVDIAFRTGHMKNSSLVAEAIGAAAMSVTASPEYLEKHGIPETHLCLKNHNCIQYTRSPKWRLKKAGSWYEYTPSNHIMTDSGECLREFSIRGRGLACLPSTLTEFAVKKGRLITVLQDYECDVMPVNALRTANKNTPRRVLKLMSFITEELGSRPRDVSEFSGYK